MIQSASPSVKNQIMGGKVCFKGKTLLGIVNKQQQCFALLPKVNFPANDLNFHWRWRWWDQIQTIFLNLFDFEAKRFLEVLFVWIWDFWQYVFGLFWFNLSCCAIRVWIWLKPAKKSKLIIGIYYWLVMDFKMNWGQKDRKKSSHRTDHNKSCTGILITK